MPRKKRPREHIIADLSTNHVERYIFLCGYSVERVECDYGFDLILFTYDDNGEIENGQVFVQLKATDCIKTLWDNQTIVFSLNRSDLELWLYEPMPVILVVFDAQTNQAYWLYIQNYFEKIKDFNLQNIGETVTVRIPKSNFINEDAIRKFASYRDRVLEQTKEIIKHEE
ncbi:hypothetical protein C7H19_12635 [Aphanothece hegewaldii CCALA 016]|uniref:DUF4365 domain-containing protein n=1 Tax=Aphanothece hegewaldii CCALA 016 TaxID=2107694 RepID=A0A2T1LXB0_9CHRO|nr:DUF4365 domain-containing protein [Aphanothece hegewaldii]PSF36808.1 hypothetical protein C7H19_12635 [Aphanothece hegewaldii CCALA 016]